MGTVERNTGKRPVQSWMTDRAFCFCLVLAILMVSDVAISTDDYEGVVLAKVMKTAKDIRPCDKNARERRPGWVPGGFLPAAGPMQAERRAGPMTAAISGGWRAKREIFNQLLTTFIVIAMVWRLTVFCLCSKGYSGGRCLADDDRRPAPRLRCGGPLAQDATGRRAGTMGRGGGKRAGPSQNGGRVLRHIPFSPPPDQG